jgi:hypothetical protein
MAKDFAYRPLTPDTEYLVCIYTYQGDSIKSISKVMQRNLHQVEEILQTAKDTGRYDEYIKFYENYLRLGINARCSVSTRESQILAL